ncbi:putative sucrose-phosphate synthase 2 [Sesbania bispinosa]|nr:putative sucrose-phosphate synthase 2 [Sesbania bispinosa]
MGERTRDATEDMSEELSEGEKGDGIGEMIQIEMPKKKLQRQISNLEVWSDDKKEKKLNIVLFEDVSMSKGILIIVIYLPSH